MEVLTFTNKSILPRMDVLTLQRRVYYPDGSIQHYKHENITQMEVLTLQTRVYYADGNVNITNTEYITQLEVFSITNTSIFPRWKY